MNKTTKDLGQEKNKVIHFILIGVCVVLIAAIFLLAGCSSASEVKKTNTKTPTDTKVPTKPTTTTVKPVSPAAIFSAITKCESLTGLENQSNCIKKEAVKTKNALVCEKITAPKIQNECMAQVSADAKTCELLSNNKYNPTSLCFQYRGINELNASMCEKAKVAYTNVSMGMNYAYVNACYVGIAVKQKNANLCMRINTETDAGKTKLDYCHLKVSMASKDLSLCSRIVDATKKAACLAAK